MTPSIGRVLSTKATHSIEPTWLARLTGRLGTNYQRAEVEQGGVLVQRPSNDGSIGQALRFGHLHSLTLEHGWVWSRIRLITTTGEVTVLGGFSRSEGLRFAQHLNAKRTLFDEAAQILTKQRGQIEQLSAWLNQPPRARNWLANHSLQEMVAEAAPLSGLRGFDADQLTEEVGLASAITNVQNFLEDPALFRLESNAIFTDSELNRFKRYFDEVESNPLTKAQRVAVITHEDNTLVIAGAGSGKTSVIVAKAGYLLKKGFVKPEQLLLLAFNRAAALEISERIEQKIGIKVTATTFHALGSRILAEVDRKKPTLASFADDKHLLVRQIEEHLAYLMEDSATSKTIRSWFQGFFAPYKSAFEFPTKGEHYSYLKDHEIRTIRDELMNWTVLSSQLDFSRLAISSAAIFTFRSQSSIDASIHSFSKV